MGYKWHKVIMDLRAKEDATATDMLAMLERLSKKAVPDMPSPFAHVKFAENVMFEQAQTDELIDGALETLSAYIDGHSTDDALVQVINELTASQEARQGR